MFGRWNKHYDGIVEGRPVTVKTYSEGGYRVETTQGADDYGSVGSDAKSVTVIPPTAKGRRIDIDGETLDEVREQLKGESFSDDAIKDIMGHFPD